MFVYYFKEWIYTQPRIFSYFNTRSPTLNEQPFLPFVILPPYFCSDLSKNKHSNSTKKRTAATETATAIETETATSGGKCHFNPLMEYLRWAFLSLFCYVHSLLTFIFIGVWRLFFCSRYYCIKIFPRVYLKNFTQHHNTTAAITKKRVGTVFVILFT